jgi:cyclophilin family peptidyl-prolyl cis-trans isomerase
MLKSKVPFVLAWSSIASAFAFCFYTAGLLYFFDQTFTVADQLSIKSQVASGPLKKSQGMVTIETNYGTIKIELLPNDAPNTVQNFTRLASQQFYDGVRFHRVINGFMIQTGDPFSKDTSLIDRWGTGGPGYSFNDEINKGGALYAHGYPRGTVAMANSGPNTNGSQFFIMQADNNLPALYTIFGKVTEGLSVVDKIASVKTTGSPYDRPLTEVLIKKVVVE